MEKPRTFEEWVEQHNRDPWAHQDENGVDLVSLRNNLKLTPTQRIERALRGLELTLEVRRAGETAGLRRAPSSSDPS